MAAGPYIIKNGVLLLKPQTGTPSNLSEGALYVDDSDGILVNYDGSTSRKVVNVSSAQTLTNKTLTSPAITSPSGLTKNDVGLGNVDNTSNATERAAVATLTNKTINSASNTLTIDGDEATVSDLALTALKTNLSDASKFIVRDASGVPVSNTKAVPAGVVVGDTDSQTLTNKTLTAPVINSPTGLTKSDVGLSNVDNTSDATKNAASVTLTNKTLTSPVINTASASGTVVVNYEDFTEVATPSTPASGKVRVYSKSNGLMYSQDDAGNETLMSNTSGTVVQVEDTSTGGVSTGTTIIPYDDTRPQITEGDEYLSRSITPSSIGNKLRIDVSFWGAVSAANTDLVVALFIVGSTNALAAVSSYGTGSNFRAPLTFTYWYDVASTSTHTFTVRAGPSAAATVTMNGSGGARKFGGAAISSITITEYQG